MRFKNYLLTEAQMYLSKDLGDILDALQSLNEDLPHLGNRKKIDAAKEIVDRIRQVIKGDWPDSENATLQVLQKIGVAIMNAIDSNGDLAEIIGSAVQELEQATKSGSPVNDIGSDQNPEKTDSQASQ